MIQIFLAGVWAGQSEVVQEVLADLKNTGEQRAEEPKKAIKTEFYLNFEGGCFLQYGVKSDFSDWLAIVRPSFSPSLFEPGKRPNWSLLVDQFLIDAYLH